VVELPGSRGTQCIHMRVESTFQESKSRGWMVEASLVKDEARAGSFVAGALPGDVVGQSFGRLLHTPRQT
jgi:hypothetical protein